MRLLSKHGRKGATMRAICDEVGVKAPTLYHHFGDLAGLHRAAIDETYVRVADAYRRGATSVGPLQGLRDGWATFNHFAHEEPNMARLVIEQVLAGEPPSMVESTLSEIALDLSSFHSAGKLRFGPKKAVQMLWMAGLGSVCFTASDRGQDDETYPELQESMIEIMLDALMKK